MARYCAQASRGNTDYGDYDTDVDIAPTLRSGRVGALRAQAAGCVSLRFLSP